MAYKGGPVRLALSGGGFRATLFHLGVIRLLKQAGALNFDTIKQVSAVSGGSILAGHLILNWEKYTESNESFDKIARNILAFSQKDVRGSVIRKWVLACATLFPRFFGSEKNRWSLGNLLQAEYSFLYDHARLIKLQADERPKVRFHSTSLTTGSPCYFDETGFYWQTKETTKQNTNKDVAEKVVFRSIESFDMPVAFAVAASSAFPPLFPPIDIDNDTLSCSAEEFEHTQRLTDGGVYDNLGIDSFIGDESQLAETIIISDAEGNFDSDFDAKYSFPVTRNVRASDLLMKRVSALRLNDLSSSHVRIKIRDAVKDSSEAILSPDSQRALINVRTDLDVFTALEVTALITHGYNKARETLIEKGLIDVDTPGASWDPLGNLDQLRDPSVSHDLRSSRIRAWRLWSKYDPISWATGLYAVFIILLLATPTAFLAYRSAQDAVKTAIAQQEATAAQLEAAKAQQAAAISQANAIFADAKAAEASALVTGILGGRSSPWKLKGIGDCTRQDTSSSEGEFPLDQICTQGGAKSAVCWDGITFKNSGGFKYAAAWCTYKTTSATQCSGGSAPGRLYECAPTSGIEPTLKNVSVCVGDTGCPPAAIHLPCGTSAQEFANDKCLTSTVTRVSSKVGNVCATDIFDVACAPKPAPTPPPPQPAKTEVTRPLKVCTGEYERACDPHDSYLYCGTDVKAWAAGRCEKSTVTQLNDRGGNKCGYSLFEVLCTSTVK